MRSAGPLITKLLVLGPAPRADALTKIGKTITAGMSTVPKRQGTEGQLV